MVKEKEQTKEATKEVQNELNDGNYNIFCPCGEFINLETGLKNDFTGFRPGGALE